MKNRLIKLSILVLFLVSASLAIVVVAAQSDGDVQSKIESAMSAAPMGVSHDATILDYETDAEGKYIVLQEGTNEWTCFPDWPASPGNDPLCYDPTFMKWNDALMAGTDPDITEPGLAYMLQGGSDPSNTDPLAAEPAEGEDWVSAPPHIMILLPDPLDMSLFSADHHSGKPWVMWAGTPYEHIMMPIAEMQDN